MDKGIICKAKFHLLSPFPSVLEINKVYSLKSTRVQRSERWKIGKIVVILYVLQLQAVTSVTIFGLMLNHVLCTLITKKEHLHGSMIRFETGENKKKPFMTPGETSLTDSP